MITENYRVLIPAYGRDYKRVKDVEQDFRAGKDFILRPEGCYISIRDFAPGVTVEIRYARGTKVTLVKV
jgi:hypothetical protein